MNLVRTLLDSATAVTFLSVSVCGQETLRVSIDSSGMQGDKDCLRPALSADGMVVAFQSEATNLVSGDTNGDWDVFVHDRNTGTTSRVSLDSSGTQADGDSFSPSISTDGRFVAFSSVAGNLVPNDKNGSSDIFVHDRLNEITERVSVDSSGAEGNGSSGQRSSVTGDGRIIAFESYASNLVEDDRNFDRDVFVHDCLTGITELVSIDASGQAAAGPSQQPSVSADGQFVAFTSKAPDLVSQDLNGLEDVFVHDRVLRVTERASVDSSGGEGNGYSMSVALSADAACVAFSSRANNLVPGDTNGAEDVFVHIRSLKTTERVSVSSGGVQADAHCYLPSISADSIILVFFSGSTNLVDNDTNGQEDVFFHDRSVGVTVRASVSTSGAQAKWGGRTPVVSANGLVISFHSPSPDLVPDDTNEREDIFVHEICPTDASWWNYGTGFSGERGVPAFVALSEPVIDSILVLQAGNSSSGFTVGILLAGLQSTLIPTCKGGDLLVIPISTMLLALPPNGIVLSFELPGDDALCGLELFLQILERDHEAAKGLSFTAGMALRFGY